MRLCVCVCVCAFVRLCVSTFGRNCVHVFVCLDVRAHKQPITQLEPTARNKCAFFETLTMNRCRDNSYNTQASTKQVQQSQQSTDTAWVQSSIPQGAPQQPLPTHRIHVTGKPKGLSCNRNKTAYVVAVCVQECDVRKCMCIRTGTLTETALRFQENQGEAQRVWT